MKCCNIPNIRQTLPLESLSSSLIPRGYCEMLLCTLSMSYSTVPRAYFFRNSTSWWKRGRRSIHRHCFL